MNRPRILGPIVLPVAAWAALAVLVGATWALAALMWRAPS